MCPSRPRVEVTPNFPEPCRYVLEALGEVYRNDAWAQPMTPEERLRFHQLHSALSSAKSYPRLPPSTTASRHCFRKRSGGYMQYRWSAAPTLRLPWSSAGLCPRLPRPTTANHRRAPRPYTKSPSNCGIDIAPEDWPSCNVASQRANPAGHSPQTAHRVRPHTEGSANSA